MTINAIFFNQVFDKKRLKVLITWVFKEFGEKQALRVVEELKTIGFYNATQAGLSIGLNDLTTPNQKSFLLSQAEVEMNICDQDFNGGRITATERNQRIVDTWHRVSETLRKQVVEHFSTYDQLNPVYIMALSGARGNFSQVRQLVGMRGLMADPQGQIISFPIRSNLREGLTLTEYFISCSGARKGLVDTALRTADTGYLTRRLVDVSHHVVIKKICCNTEKGIIVRVLKSENKVLLSLSDRLVGRVLAQNIEYPKRDFDENLKSISFLTPDKRSFSEVAGATQTAKLADFAEQSRRLASKTTRLQSQPQISEASQRLQEQPNSFLAQKNQEIDPNLAFKIQTVKDQVRIRSPLTCALTHSVCQLCYGWSLSQGRLVSLGEAVGVIAAQSIGEPGTQLTMRTFHTGGVFSGDLLQEMRAPHSGKIAFPKAFQGLMIRTTDGRIAFLTKTSGEILLKKHSTENMKALYRRDFTDRDNSSFSSEKTEQIKKQTCLQFQALSLLFVRQSESVKKNQLLAQISILAEQGNQPIKSRQTVFAELSGKVFETQGATTTKKFIKNINKLSKNTETLILKNEIVNTLKERVSNSIHPEKSAKIGFFHILATQKAATFDVNTFPIVLPSRTTVKKFQNILPSRTTAKKLPIALPNQALAQRSRASLTFAEQSNKLQISEKLYKTKLEKQSLSGSLHLQYLNKQLQKLCFSNHLVSSETNVSSNFARVIASNHLGNLKGNEKEKLSKDNNETSKFFKTKPRQQSCQNLQSKPKQLHQQSWEGNGQSSQSKARQSKLVKSYSRNLSFCETKQRGASLLRDYSFNLNKQSLSESAWQLNHHILQSKTAETQTAKLSDFAKQSLRFAKQNDDSKAGRLCRAKSFYNPYIAQFFTSTHNKAVIVSLLHKPISKKKVNSRSPNKFRLSEVVEQKQTLSAAFDVNRKYSLAIATAPKITKIYKQTEQKTDCFFLQTIAQEGDLVDFKYKEASFKNL